VQVKKGGNQLENTRLIRIWAVGAITPFERGLVWLENSTRDLWHNYFYLRGVRTENRQLRDEIEQMRLEQVRLREDAAQAQRLQALLAFKEQFISQTLAAQVIGWSGSEQSRSIYIDKGAREGIKPDMAIITKDGIVGKVLQVYGSNALERSVSQVLLIDDQTSGVGVILENSRLQGILRGRPSGDVVLEKVMSDETVPVGELVLTSGGDGIFPKGLPVGRVTKVAVGSDLFLNIRVRPAANLSRLEEVLVVTKIDERQAQPEQTGPVRAIDILAERLPTVPPKPDAATDAAKTSGAQPSGTAISAPSATPNAPATGVGGSSNPGAAVVKKPAASASSSAAGSTTGPVATTAPGAKTSGAATKPATAAPSKPQSASGTNPATTAPSKPAAAPATKPAAKPAQSTVTPKPQPAAQDTPQ